MDTTIFVHYPPLRINMHSRRSNMVVRTGRPIPGPLSSRGGPVDLLRVKH